MKSILYSCLLVLIQIWCLISFTWVISGFTMHRRHLFNIIKVSGCCWVYHGTTVASLKFVQAGVDDFFLLWCEKWGCHYFRECIQVLIVCVFVANLDVHAHASSFGSDFGEAIGYAEVYICGLCFVTELYSYVYLLPILKFQICILLMNKKTLDVLIIDLLLLL